MQQDYFKKLLEDYFNRTSEGSHPLDDYYNSRQGREETPLDKEVVGHAMLDRIHSRMELTVTRKKPQRLWMYSAAAAVLFAAATFVWWKTFREIPTLGGRETYVTAKGEKRKLILPDGSIVTLNSSSNISLDSGFSSSKRSVHMEGEAYFEVVHDPTHPFIVHSQQMDVKVLGTIFNLRAYPGEASETFLVKGAVQIFTPNSNLPVATLSPSQKFTMGKNLSIGADRQLMTKGDDFIISRPKVEKTEVDDQQQIAWMHNRLSFDNQRFAEVARLLERWYDVQIVIEDPKLLEYRFTGTFNDTGLEEILEALKSSQQFSYRKEGDRIRIY